MGRRKRGGRKRQKTYKGCTVHDGERGGQYIMVRKKGGGTRREYI